MVGGAALGLAAEVRARARARQRVLELAVEALDDCNALGELGTLGKDQRAQRADVIRQSIGRGRHGAMEGRFRSAFQR